jgi:thiol:disulfide interchange protein DsbC
MRKTEKWVSVVTKSALAILMLAGITNALADGQELARRIREQYPSTNISAVRESAIKGLYEVVMGRNVAYTDESGRYFVFGHLYDMREQKDLTAGVLDDLNKVDVSALPLADAIKVVRGKGERKLFVFSDPDCPYCKQLETELAKLDNLTSYIFMMPLEALHPNAKGHARAIWCAPDRGRAWREFMASGKLPSGAATCNTPIERILALGERLGISGTPSTM